MARYGECKQNSNRDGRGRSEERGWETRREEKSRTGSEAEQSTPSFGPWGCSAVTYFAMHLLQLSTTATYAPSEQTTTLYI